MCKRGHTSGRDRWRHCLTCAAEAQARYQRTPAGLRAKRRYYDSPKGLATHARYNASRKGQERSGRYDASTHGQLAKAMAKLQYRMRKKEVRIAELEVALDASS